MRLFLSILVLLWNYFLTAEGNAMLKPRHRGMMWARDAYNSGGYNYMGLNCGGTHKVKQHEGKCGLCGDAYDGARRHEKGGKYATGKLSQAIRKGQTTIPVQVLLNSDQGGYFEFRLCNSNGTKETQACFDQHLLSISEARVQGDQYAYVIHRAGLIVLNVEIPEKLKCNKCILQWKYVTGNTFGRDQFGHGCLGCGPQETFINCADIKIEGWETVTLHPPMTPPTTYATAPPTAPPTTPIPTTTTPKPTTTTKAPTTTKAKQIRHGQNSVTSRHRRPVTDFDEGSRRRYQVYNGIAAQPIRPKKGHKVTGVPIAVQPFQPAQQAPVVAQQPQAPVNVPQQPVPVNVPQQPVPVNIPQKPAPVNIQKQPAPIMVTPKPAPMAKPVEPKVVQTKPSRPKSRGIGIPLMIPKPPKMSQMQIDALSSNQNVIPHHDSLQKYVKVGSSKIISSRDFATVRKQQMPTPPTKINMSTSPTISKGLPGVPGIRSFSEFGGQMSIQDSANSKQSLQKADTKSIMNEYSSAEPNIPAMKPPGSYSQRSQSSFNFQDGAALNHLGQKPKKRIGRTPTPVPLPFSRYGGGRKSVDPMDNVYRPSQYGGTLPSRYQPQIPESLQQQQPEVKSTQIPVVETSTHRAKNSVGAWRPFNINNQEQMFFDKPLNLFTVRKDSTFKPPAITERYTNFKIGSEKNKLNVRQPIGQKLEVKAQVNKVPPSPETYVGHDGHMYYQNEAGIFPVTAPGPQNVASAPTGSMYSNMDISMSQYQNNGQQSNSFDALGYSNANDAAASDQVNRMTVDKKTKTSALEPGLPGGSSSTDKFNVYKAAGISAGKILHKIAGGRSDFLGNEANVLFDVFGVNERHAKRRTSAKPTQQPYQFNNQQQQQSQNQHQQQYNIPTLDSRHQQQQNQFQQQFQQQGQYVTQNQQSQQELQFSGQYGNQQNQPQNQQQQMSGQFGNQQTQPPQQPQQFSGQYENQQNQQSIQQQQMASQYGNLQQNQQQQSSGQFGNQQNQQQLLQQLQFLGQFGNQNQQNQQQQFSGQYENQQQQQQQRQQQQQQQQNNPYIQQVGWQQEQPPQQQYNEQYNQQFNSFNQQQNKSIQPSGQFNAAPEGIVVGNNFAAWSSNTATDPSPINRNGNAWWHQWGTTPPNVPTSAPSPKPTTPMTTTENTLKQTTDKMDAQIAELKKLREKLDQLQQLINIRQKGFDEPTLSPTVVTPSRTSPLITTAVEQTTTVSVIKTGGQRGQSPSSSDGQTNKKSVRELLEEILRRRYQEESTSSAAPTTSSSVNFVQPTTTASEIFMPTAKANIQSTTLPSTMPKNTKDYIARLKAQMLKSIKEANERKLETPKPQPTQPVLRNQESVAVDVRPFSHAVSVAIPIKAEAIETYTTKSQVFHTAKTTTVDRQKLLQKLKELRQKMKKRQPNQTNVQDKLKPDVVAYEKITKPVPKPTQSARTTPERKTTKKVATYPITSTSASVAALIQNLRNGAPVDLQPKATTAISLIPDIGVQSLEKPALSEMNVKQTASRQRIVNIESLTSINNPVSTKTSSSDNGNYKRKTTTADNVYVNNESTTVDGAFKRRMDFLERMKKYMVKRPTHIIASDNGGNNRPTHLPAGRPNHLLSPAADGSARLKLSNRPVHIIDHPNNGRPTIHDNHKTVLSQTGNTHMGVASNDGSAQQYSPTYFGNQQQGPRHSNNKNNNANTYDNVSASMLNEVNQMIAKKKGEGRTREPPTTVANEPANHVLASPVNKDLFLQMLRSMSARRQNRNFGR